MEFSKLGELSDSRCFISNTRKASKATVRRSGHLGFSSEAAKDMQLKSDMRLLVAVSGEDLYVKVSNEDERGYKVRSSSKYFSVDMRAFFPSIGIRYEDKEHTTIFDISQHGTDDADGAPIWKFKRRCIELKHRIKVEKC